METQATPKLALRALSQLRGQAIPLLERSAYLAGRHRSSSRLSHHLHHQRAALEALLREEADLATHLVEEMAKGVVYLRAESAVRVAQLIRRVSVEEAALQRFSSRNES